MKFIVEAGDKGKRLDKFLQEKLDDLSRSQIQKMIKAGEILVNGKEVAAHYFLKAGERVQGKRQKARQTGEQAKGQPAKFYNEENFSNSGSAGALRAKVKVEIIAEEKDYIVVNKPAGMVVHHDSAHKSGTLVDWLVERYPEIKKVGDDAKRPGIVHRLDKDVSGLMVIARSQEMFECLKKQFQERKTEKEYLALAHGVVSKDEDLIEGVIGRSAKSGTMVAGGAKAKKSREAATAYNVVERFKNFTLLQIKILTGRTHQIRAHMKSIGHSLVGDELYVTRDVKRKKQQEELGRVWLFAEKLGFKDLEGNWREYKVKRPKELEDFLGGIK
ncbi:RluA family pseudouridine synthase [Candidatus Kuenenbacteria bacterium]|nr:RluA family pseudouridine synthase [Candidatus Kuenenbacteria bacterium]